MTPKISVIVPVYKVEKYLEKCISSILNQTFSDFELLLIDDGSPDNSGNICDRYANIDNRIKVFHIPNQGVSAARNIGIDNSVGEYICFIDSDDYISKDYLKILYQTICKNKVDIVICNFMNFTDGESEPELEGTDCSCSIIEINTQSLENIFIDNINYERYVIASLKLYHSSLWHEFRFPVGRLFEDKYVYYKIICKAKNIALIDSALYARRLHQESITHQSYSKYYWCKIESGIEQVEYFHTNNMQRLVEISYDKLLYYFWGILNSMHDSGIDDSELVYKYRKELKKVVKYLKVTKTYPFIKLLKQYYIAYLKNID